MTEPLATVEAASHAGHPVLRVTGEIDMSNAEPVGDQLRADIGDAPTAYVDLTPVGFFDSQGLRMLHHLADTLKSTGTTLIVIAPPTGIVGSVLHLTGMDEDLDVRETLPT